MIASLRTAADVLASGIPPGHSGGTAPDSQHAGHRCSSTAVGPIMTHPPAPQRTPGHVALTTYRVPMIKACLNGDRTGEDHQGVPITPDELGRDAAAAVAAGADALHIHPRGASGLETLEYADVQAAVTAVRRNCPGVPVGVSTREAARPGSGRAAPVDHSVGIGSRLRERQLPRERRRTRRGPLAGQRHRCRGRAVHP